MDQRTRMRRVAVDQDDDGCDALETSCYWSGQSWVLGRRYHHHHCRLQVGDLRSGEGEAGHGGWEGSSYGTHHCCAVDMLDLARV